MNQLSWNLTTKIKIYFLISLLIIQYNEFNDTKKTNQIVNRTELSNYLFTFNTDKFFPCNVYSLANYPKKKFYYLLLFKIWHFQFLNMKIIYANNYN